jgi:hypothetical protein
MSPRGRSFAKAREQRTFGDSKKFIVDIAIVLSSML